MDFFARQEQSRRTTKYLVLLFTLAFLCIALFTAIAVALIFEFLPPLDQAFLSTTIGTRQNGGLGPFFATMAAVMLIMLVASMYRSATLSKGGSRVARMLGGTEIQAETTDPLHRRLINVVEEISIASGIPVPDIFVLEAESGINAFAAGLSQADAAVAVTRGALERLNRAELQGVIAHEFSHILNGDMRLNQRLMGFSFGILVLALAGRWMLRSARLTRRSRNNSGSVAIALGLALAAIGSIGIFFSRLIKAAVSRQREVLADASAVQFTREPEALAGALKKIGGYTANLSATDSEEVAHMLFGSGSKAFRGWFATHPPITERIRALDPTFDPNDFEVSAGPLPPHMHEDDAAGIRQLSSETAPSLESASVIEKVGQIESADIGNTLRAALPADLYDAAHSHELSFLLVLALACSPNPDTAMRQMIFIEQRLGRQRSLICTRMHNEISELDVQSRLPLLELSMPALRQRPDEQINFLLDLLDELAQMRDRYELFNFVLPHVLRAYLGDRASSRLERNVRVSKLPPPDACNHLIRAVASFGHSNTQAATAAYKGGLEALAIRGLKQQFATVESNNGDYLSTLESAVESMRHQPQRIKRALLRAVFAAISYDSEIRIEELELFRAIAATLNIPTPPLSVGKIRADA